VRRLEKLNKGIKEGRKREDWDEGLGEWKAKVDSDV
jgi:hypothetical protein